MELRLELRLSQKLVMTPQLQQAIKLLQLSRLELQQTLSQHLMENPLLEDATSDAEEGEAAGAEEGGPEKKESSPDGEGGSEGSESTAAEFSEPLSSEEWDNYYETDWSSGSYSKVS